MIRVTRYAKVFGAMWMMTAGMASACGSTAGDPTSTTSAVSKAVGPAGGVVESDGVKLDIPAGALSSDVTITVAQASESEHGAYDALSPVFQFSPDGLTFAKPATVAIAFQGDATGATVVWSNAGGFDALASTVSGGKTMTAQVMHFSRGFVGKPVHGDQDGSAPEGSTEDAAGDADATSDGDAHQCLPSNSPCNIGALCCSSVCTPAHKCQ